jgi:nucleotide-binding universal stress UspA family protein
MFRKLLLPIDLSDRHQRALEIAREMAGAAGEVVLLHVIEIIRGLPMDEEKVFYARLEKVARGHLELLASTPVHGQPTPRMEIRFGNRVAEIVRYASEAASDLIVLTAPPLAPTDPAAGWGSLSYKVSLCSPCPVLLVK